MKFLSSVHTHCKILEITEVYQYLFVLNGKHSSLVQEIFFLTSETGNFYGKNILVPGF
jgi:hypothetical protein